MHSLSHQTAAFSCSLEPPPPCTITEARSPRVSYSSVTHPTSLSALPWPPRSLLRLHQLRAVVQTHLTIATSFSIVQLRYTHHRCDLHLPPPLLGFHSMLRTVPLYRPTLASGLQRTPISSKLNLLRLDSSEPGITAELLRRSTSQIDILVRICCFRLT